MKIQIASDLHLELRADGEPDPATEFRPAPDRDVLVLAGDIATGVDAFGFIVEEALISPVIYVPGNHEYYSRRTREEIDDNWRAFASLQPNLHYLACEAVTINGVRFWGAPWYSDLFGRRDKGFLLWVNQNIEDFRAWHGKEVHWTIERHLEAHRDQTEQLRAQADEVDVVVTHWPPTKQAIAPRFADDLLNGYFVNDREDLVEEIGANLWISGHVHDPYDCVVSETRCVANPAGYPGEVQEVGGFAPNRTIEVPERSGWGSV